MNTRNDLALTAGERLKRARKRLGWSQQKLSALLEQDGQGANQSAVSGWERGDILITAERAVQLERIFSREQPGALPRSVLRPDLFEGMPPAANDDVAPAPVPACSPPPPAEPARRSDSAVV